MLPCSSSSVKAATPLAFSSDSQRVITAPRRRRCSTVVRAEKSTYSGKGVAPPAKGHHFLHIDDFSTDEIRAMLETAAKARHQPPMLPKASSALPPFLTQP